MFPRPTRADAAIRLTQARRGRFIAFVTSAEAIDGDVRLRAFDFLNEQTAIHGEVLPWAILSKGFPYDGRRVPLIGPQGIFKPAVLPEMPLSIATAPVREGQERPYDDGLDEHGLLAYRYRGTDPRHRDNVGLRLGG